MRGSLLLLSLGLGASVALAAPETMQGVRIDPLF